MMLMPITVLRLVLKELGHCTNWFMFFLPQSKVSLASDE
jgi:hypothetical protein